MKRFATHLAVAVVTFLLSVTVTTNFIIRRLPAGQRATAPVTQRSPQRSETNDTPSPLVAAERKLRSLSPYDIEIYVDDNPQADVQEVWRRLGIPSKYNGMSHYGNGGTFLGECSGCEAETYDFELDGEPGREVLLRVSSRPQEACRYLVFKSADAGSGRDGWELLGHVDHDFGRHRMPQHAFVMSGGKSWLIVTVQGGSGTGVSLYYDRLFTVEKGRLVEVLNYPSDGHQSNFSWEAAREFNGRVLDCRIRGGVATVEVEFTVSYSTYDEDSYGDVGLWKKKQRATFTRRLSSKRWALDPLRSDLSEKELEAVYDIDSLSYEDLLRYNFDELRRIAIGEWGDGKAWLREFLKRCGNTAEKRALRRMLR